MTGFEKHKAAGLVAGAIYTTALFIIMSNYLQLEALQIAVLGVTGFTSTLIGAVAPDIDSYNSVPARKLDFVLSYTTSLIIGMYTYQAFSLNLLELAGLLISSAALVLLLIPAFRKLNNLGMPTHRGLIHSISFGMTASAITSFLVGKFLQNLVEVPFQPVIFLGLLIGFGTHLWVDGILIQKIVELFTKFYRVLS